MAVMGLLVMVVCIVLLIIDIAANGLEVMQAVKRQPFDVILMDVQMPNMDGIAMSEALARKAPQQKILMMTGYANQRERAASVEAIVIDVVQKPFTLPEIRKQVSSALMVG